MPIVTPGVYPLGLFTKIRRHAAVAGGDFTTLFKKVDIPPLPQAAARLVAEINRPVPDVDRLVTIISSEPEFSAKVLRSVNSSLFALRNRVTTIQHAVVLLGSREIRALALSYAVVSGIPRPTGPLFDHQAFWTDSVLRAMLARAFAGKVRRGQEDEAFTTALLADVALPVLLKSWRDYYAPVVSQWRTGSARLSAIERDAFGWDHAQAGAWVLGSWEFPEETVCFVGVHNRAPDELQELGLEETIALPLAIASNAPSILKPDGRRCAQLVHTATKALAVTRAELAEIIAGVHEQFDEVQRLFGLQRATATETFEDLLAATTAGVAEEPA